MRWWVAGLVLVAVLAGVIYFTRLRSAATPHEAPQQASASIAGYVDPAICAGCHADIWETYRSTGMGRSFSQPVLSNTIGDNKSAPTFYHKPSESYFTMLERDGRFYQRRYQIGFDGKETNIMEKEIDFVVGSGNHVRAYLHRTSRNKLVELPLARYAEKGGSWAMNPGYDHQDHPGFSRTITYGCMFCHNGFPEVPAGSGEAGADTVFPGRLPEGIDCQRCHGPGGKHVQAAESGDAKPEDIRKAIVNPSRLNPERQMEVCMQCHLETTSSRLPNSIVRYGRSPFSYRPGEPLGDFMLQFDHAPGSASPGGSYDDKFEIAGAAYRLRRSECFQKSGGALLCTTCHNPHDIPRGEEAVRHYNGVCSQCHDAAVKQLAASGKHPQSADCIGCHMPKRRTDDVVHAVMTDHYIQRRKPERDLLAPLAESHVTEDNGYRGKVVLYYPQDLPNGPDRELYLAVAQVSQKSNLSAGITALAAAIDKYHPGPMQFYLELADAMRDNGQMAKALPIYEDAVRREPNSLPALRKLGVALRSSGQPSRATEFLKRALDLAPADAATWHELGLNYVDLGSKPQAIAAFEKATELDEDPEVYNSLGAVLLESADLARAEPAFREAIRIRPAYAEAHSNLGNVLSASGRFEEARYHFEAALRFNPNYAAARQNYALALARVNRFEEAQRQVEAELKIDPGNPVAHDLLGNLLVARGQVKPAASQYQEAIKLRPEFGRAHLDLGELLADSGDVAEALPHLQKAAASPEPGVREEALQALGLLGKAR
ncbi:MAG TPA: tetratricopeptide repeat protein [Bryobacteraceae bacterium]|nr:tetratricopeptide repeat protein [Bryobacteraceae bacterium]